MISSVYCIVSSQILPVRQWSRFSYDISLLKTTKSMFVGSRYLLYWVKTVKEIKDGYFVIVKRYTFFFKDRRLYYKNNVQSMFIGRTSNKLESGPRVGLFMGVRRMRKISWKSLVKTLYWLFVFLLLFLLFCCHCVWVFRSSFYLLQLYNGQQKFEHHE